MLRWTAFRFTWAILFALAGTSYGAEAAPAPDSKPATIFFPPAKGSWEKVDPASVGWNAEKLEAALEFARSKFSSGVVILHHGRILAEHHWDLESAARRANGKGRDYAMVVRGKDSAGHVIEDVASIQKSVASMLVGIAQNKGLLRLADPVDKYLGPGWSQATREQEKEITIRHLITMSSGLNDDLTFEAAAGTKWRYNTAAYSRTVQVLAAATKTKPNEFTREWLIGRIGMNDSHWVERAGSADQARINGLGFATTARDLARFGLLILANGQWNGETIIADRDYLRAALHPSQDLNPSYGYLWWLNGQSVVARGAGVRTKGPLIPSAPADLVAALGAGERKLYVVPSLGLVVTRLGAPTGAGFDNEFWKALMAAAPSLP